MGTLLVGTLLMLPTEALELPQRLLEHARLLSRRDRLLELLPRGGVIAEVGVGLGDFTAQILAVCQPARFIAIDDFRLHELEVLWGVPTAERFGGGTHEAFYRQRFARQIQDGRMVLRCGDSAAMLAGLEDCSLDMAYIDADHQYESVRRDLAAMLPKLRADAWAIVNDYVMVTELGAHEFYGVVHAANEFMIEHDWGISYFALQTRMFCDVAMRPNALLQAEGARLQHLAAQGAAILQSSSWRMTSPLRAAARAAKRLISPT